MGKATILRCNQCEYEFPNYNTGFCQCLKQIDIKNGIKMNRIIENPRIIPEWCPMGYYIVIDEKYQKMYNCTLC